MKRAIEILIEIFEPDRETPLNVCISLSADEKIIIQAMEEYGKQMYNLAVEECASAARLESTCKDHSCTGCEYGCCMPVTRLHKDSILKLKK